MFTLDSGEEVPAEVTRLHGSRDGPMLDITVRAEGHDSHPEGRLLMFQDIPASSQRVRKRQLQDIENC